MNYILTHCNHCSSATYTLENGNCERCKKDKSKKKEKHPEYIRAIGDVLDTIKKKRIWATKDLKEILENEIY